MSIVKRQGSQASDPLSPRGTRKEKKGARRAISNSLPGRSRPSGSGGPSTLLPPERLHPRLLADAAALTGGGSGALRGKVNGWMARCGLTEISGDGGSSTGAQGARHSGRGLRPSVDAAVSRRRCAPASL
jgi:hypothetical protein